MAALVSSIPRMVRRFRRMFLFKACPKCHGDIYLDHDRFGTFADCLQCGSLWDVKVSELPDVDGAPDEVGELRVA